MSYLAKAQGLSFTVCFVIVFQMVQGSQHIIWYVLFSAFALTVNSEAF